MTAELISDAVEAAKNIGVVLTSASAVSYATGYLALRSRARALGVDPGFTFFDQAYVFAGFRFALIALVALLVVSPAVILAKLAAEAAAPRLKPRSRDILERLAVVTLAVVTLAGFQTLFVEGALLDNGSAHRTPLQKVLVSGVLGNGSAGVIVILAATATAAATILWIRRRYAQTGQDDSLTAVLMVIAALQLVLLPVQYGIFFADRTARALERAPEGVAVGQSLGVWLLDRGADRASLLTRRPGGGLAVITVRAETLDGIAVVDTVPIADIVRSGEAP